MYLTDKCLGDHLGRQEFRIPSFVTSATRIGTPVTCVTAMEEQGETHRLH